jgi:hypothetical protein
MGGFITKTVECCDHSTECRASLYEITFEVEEPADVHPFNTFNQATRQAEEQDEGCKTTLLRALFLEVSTQQRPGQPTEPPAYFVASLKRLRPFWAKPKWMARHNLFILISREILFTME